MSKEQGPQLEFRVPVGSVGTPALGCPGVHGSEPVRAGVFALGGAGLGWGRPLPVRRGPLHIQLWHPLWQAEDSSRHGVEGRGTGEKDRGPSVEGRPLPFLALPLLPPHLIPLFWLFR